MESSQYFIAKSDKYVLVRKIGNRFFRIISDTNITPVELIYQKICSEGYTSEQELFQDVKAKLFCPEIAGLFCRIAGLFCHDSRANLSLKPVCFGIAIS